MNKLLSVLILLATISVASAEEIHLGCWKEDMDQLFLEIDIDLEQKKLWMRPGDYLNEIIEVSDKYIIAIGGINRTIRTTINRYTGQLDESLITKDGTPTSNLNRLNCKQLEKLF